MAKNGLKTPYADLLPPLSSEEKAALEASIKAEGVRDPIVIDEDGNILDGHHRYSIDASAPTRLMAGLSNGEKRAFVLQANIARRNLSPEQKREVRKTMQAIAKALREEDPKKNTQERVATRLGVTRGVVAQWFGAGNRGSIVTCNSVSVPDARVKVPSKERPQVAERVRKGESPEQVAADYGITGRQVRNIAKAEDTSQQTENAPAILPEGTYNLIYADPPWRYDFSSTKSRRIEKNYSTLTVEEICEYKDAQGRSISETIAENACLYLWATPPKLREALRVMEAWGFEYVTHMVWVKDKIGAGYWVRQQHELLLIGKRGQFKPPKPALRPSSVLSAPRTKHSQKPEEFYALLERLYPRARRHEVFARKQRKGWVATGNQL